MQQRHIVGFCFASVARGSCALLCPLWLPPWPTGLGLTWLPCAETKTAAVAEYEKRYLAVDRQVRRRCEKSQ